MIHPAAKVFKGTNRNMPARNTMVQLLAPYIDHESHSAQRYRQTDDRQTDVIAYDNSRSYCVAVRSAKNEELEYDLQTVASLVHTS